MDNQHKKITGYRDLSQSEIDGMNSIKSLEKDVGALWQQIKEIDGVDQRMLAIARTELQTAFMWFVRAIAQPADPFTAPAPVETFLDRLVAEKAQIDECLPKLDQFIGSDTYNKIPQRAAQLLGKQSDLMHELQDVLAERIDLAKADQ